MNLQKPIAILVRIMAPSDFYHERQLLSKLPGKIPQSHSRSDLSNFSSEARKVGLDKICNVVSLHLPKLKKWEVRAGTDTELKLNDLFKYYDYETSAAKDLLYRFVVGSSIIFGPGIHGPKPRTRTNKFLKILTPLGQVHTWIWRSLDPWFGLQSEKWKTFVSK